jgi:uncharacterized protein YcbK (DUF882 family)
VSKYFTVDEFRSHDGAEYPPEWVADRLTSLCGVLDVIREAWGGPLTVVSGYRTAEYNARLASRSSGVAQNSQHIQGRAADIRPTEPTRVRVAVLHGVIKRLHTEGKLPRLGGLGFYVGWCHIDVRATKGHLAEWVGIGVGSEP